MRKHLPRKNTDINIIRCILLNINDKYDTVCFDYGVENQQFLLMIDALSQNELVALIEGKDKNHTSSYIITNTEKYYEWSKSNFYRQIERYVIPALEFGKAALELASKMHP